MATLTPTLATDAATSGAGFLLVLAIVVPVASVLLAFVVGDRHVKLVALAATAIGLAMVAAILVILPQHGGVLTYLLGAWTPPLGLALRADGLSAVMLAVTAVVVCAVCIFAAHDFPVTGGSTRATFAFWILLLAIWGALNTIFLGGDLFTLYVALELLTFAAVPIVSLDGRGETLRAALRYLLFALLGSVLYLVGAALLYGLHGTLDIVLLSRSVGAAPAALVAVALMTGGLLAKTALFPLHIWLPPAHASAPAAGSAILSGLVVKGSFFILLRLWFNLVPGMPGPAAAELLGALGTAAIVFGSILALRQERLKLLIAYSTLAQIGYLFLTFPLALETSGRLASGAALTGGLLQAASHATAKAAMFMAAGSIYAVVGHDRIRELGGVGRALPLQVLTFSIGGIALMGVPPGGASLAKDMLVQASKENAQWWWEIVLQAGGMFTAAYVLLVLTQAFAGARIAIPTTGSASRNQAAAPLALALCSLLLGLLPLGSYLPAPITPAPWDLEALFKLLLTVLGGAVVAMLLGAWPRALAVSNAGKAVLMLVDPVRRQCAIVAKIIERGNDWICQWPVAGLNLLLLALSLGALFYTAN